MAKPEPFRVVAHAGSTELVAEWASRMILSDRSAVVKRLRGGGWSLATEAEHYHVANEEWGKVIGAGLLRREV